MNKIKEAQLKERFSSQDQHIFLKRLNQLGFISTGTYESSYTYRHYSCLWLFLEDGTIGYTKHWQCRAIKDVTSLGWEEVSEVAYRGYKHANAGSSTGERT